MVSLPVLAVVHAGVVLDMGNIERGDNACSWRLQRRGEWLQRLDG
jgi:hypothetical protein